MELDYSMVWNLGLVYLVLFKLLGIVSYVFRNYKIGLNVWVVK